MSVKPGAPRFNPSSQIPVQIPFPPQGPFVSTIYEPRNTLPHGADAFSDDAVAGGAWPGITINSIDVLNKQLQNKNAAAAYDAQVILYLVRTLQYFGSQALFRNPFNEDLNAQDEWFQVKDNSLYHQATKVVDQWASYKQTGYRDPAMSRQLQQNQAFYNTSPAVDNEDVLLANAFIERRQLFAMAGRGGFGRRGRGMATRGGRGGQRGPAAVAS